MARRLLNGRADANNPDKRVNAVNPNIPDDQVHLPSRTCSSRVLPQYCLFRGFTTILSVPGSHGSACGGASWRVLCVCGDRRARKGAQKYRPLSTQIYHSAPSLRSNHSPSVALALSSPSLTRHRVRQVDLMAVDHHGETALHLAVRGASVSWSPRTIASMHVANTWTSAPNSRLIVFVFVHEFPPQRAVLGVGRGRSER